jgi:hypothetical protein
MKKALTRVTLFVVAIGLLTSVMSQGAMARDNARFEFAFYYQEIWKSGTASQRSNICRNYFTNRDSMLFDLSRRMSAGFNGNFGPLLRPPKRISITDAGFVINRALQIDCRR